MASSTLLVVGCAATEPAEQPRYVDGGPDAVEIYEAGSSDATTPDGGSVDAAGRDGGKGAATSASGSRDAAARGGSSRDATTPDGGSVDATGRDGGEGAATSGGSSDAALPDAGAAREVWIPSVGEPLPVRLSEYRLHPAAPDIGEVSPGALAYEPRWPLWSNGSEKQRLLVLPLELRESAGDSRADALPDAQALPVGAFFFKTFSFPRGENQALHPVETRVMRKTADGWVFARYLWNAQGSDALLLDDRLPVDVPVELSDGTRFEHQVPSPLDCRVCHEAALDPVLGYGPVQLGEREFDAPDAETREVMGYVLGNCTHCHNGGESDNASFDLRPAVFLDNVVGQATQSSASGEGVRVVPGDPDASVLWLALAGGGGEHGVKAMPPIGVQRIDEAAVKRVRAWIEGLPH